MVTANRVANAAKFKEKVSKYFRGVWSELKKVHWPDRSQLVTYTSVVIGAVILVSLMIWIVDSIFSFLLSAIL
ncbi:MAG: preprotein translocase subunit SecE [Bacillota bacterium]